MRAHAPLEQRLWRRVAVGSLDECWEWQGARTPFGHGVLAAGGRGGGTLRAHRVVFQLAHGFLPEAVCHACDNPPCCNPLHLFAGTKSTNTRDAHQKGRLKPPPRPHRSAANQKAWLRDDQAIEIRRLRVNGLSPAQIVRATSVSRSTVDRILNREGRWASC